MIENILEYKFKNRNLLREALTHPSTCVHTHSLFNYERLEFLGDSALSLVIVDLLMHKFPYEDEGDLAKRRAALVSGEILAKIASSFNLGKIIEMTKSEEKSGGRNSAHNLENVMEAIIGAIYLDAGVETLKVIIKKIWQPYIDAMHEVPIDPKSKLQEWLQRHGRPLPNYELIEAYGPRHMLNFKVSLKIDGFDEAVGEGKSKRQAEKNAALLLLSMVDE